MKGLRWAQGGRRGAPGTGTGRRAKSPSTRGAEWGHGRPGDLGHEQAPGVRGLDRPPVATRAEEQRTRGERGWPWSPEPSPDPARASPVCTGPAASAPVPSPTHAGRPAPTVAGAQSGAWPHLSAKTHDPKTRCLGFHTGLQRLHPA